MREIKFRVWDNEENKFFEPTYKAYAGELLDLSIGLGGDLHIRTLKGTEHESKFPGRYTLMQYTGLKDKNGVEIYEGDVFRIETEEDFGDTRDYYIVTFVKEWGMFATLFTGERIGYLNRGVEHLDEQMFWTFTLEDAQESEIIGNIYERPELEFLSPEQSK